MKEPFYPCALPGIARMSNYAKEVQQTTLKFAERFNLTPQYKPLSWYETAQFGLQAARQYPDATFDQINFAGDLLTWLFTVDEICDRASSNIGHAKQIEVLIHELVQILQDLASHRSDALSYGLSDIVDRLRGISSPFLFNTFCSHIIDYLRECLFEIEIQTRGTVPSISEYFRMRPFTGFYIMMPLVAVFENLSLPDFIYSLPVLKEIELTLNFLGNFSNDLHSVNREQNLGVTGFNLIFIAQNELGISMEDAIQLVVGYHTSYQQRLEQLKLKLPSYNKKINTDLNRYIDGLYTFVKGYDNWAISDTGRYGRD